MPRNYFNGSKGSKVHERVFRRQPTVNAGHFTLLPPRNDSNILKHWDGTRQLQLFSMLGHSQFAHQRAFDYNAMYILVNTECTAFKCVLQVLPVEVDLDELTYTEST